MPSNRNNNQHRRVTDAYNLLRMTVKVKLADFFADLSTNAMGTETKIQALSALLDDNQSGINIDGTHCKRVDDIRKL